MKKLKTYILLVLISGWFGCLEAQAPYHCLNCPEKTKVTLHQAFSRFEVETEDNNYTCFFDVQVDSMLSIRNQVNYFLEPLRDNALTLIVQTPQRVPFADCLLQFTVTHASENHTFFYKTDEFGVVETELPWFGLFNPTGNIDTIFYLPNRLSISEFDVSSPLEERTPREAYNFNQVVFDYHKSLSIPLAGRIKSGFQLLLLVDLEKSPILEDGDYTFRRITKDEFVLHQNGQLRYHFKR